MPSPTRPSSAEERDYTNWDRARMSVVVPIGFIVAIAIACLVAAALTSAHRADAFSVEHEKQLFSGAIHRYGERLLREVESIAASQSTLGKIAIVSDPELAGQRVSWFKTFFEHDAAFVFDGAGRPIRWMIAPQTADLPWHEVARTSLQPMLNFMRTRQSDIAGAARLTQVSLANDDTRRHVVAIARLLGRPAVIAAAAIASAPDAPIAQGGEPILISVKFVDAKVLDIVAQQLRLTDLRIVDQEEEPQADARYDLRATDGAPIASFIWTPKQPGADIVDSIVPYITVAIAGFALLAAFVLGYMRKTASAIAAGEKRLRHLAMHDPLCGLPNRMFFSERLEAMIVEVRAGSTPAAVLYIDLDHFKDVNDTLGHHVGDDLIREVTQRLSNTLRNGDLVARLGGDEFAVISSIGDDMAKIPALAQRIITAICAPYWIHGQNIVIGASIGIATVDKNCGTATDIMRFADMALYRAKNEGRNRACVYDAAMDADLSNRKLLEGDLRKAIDDEGLRLLYQPIVNKSGEAVCGVEALCRWTHPTRGEISPTEFIPVAERSGLIIELGAWVLRRACLDGQAWPDLTVSVNVSPLQFRRVDFVDMVERILAETGFPPARLEIELTESVLLGNVDTAEVAMLRLKALGVQLALDDFGTGYSSLQYLRRYPFNKLKIDRSFVQSIEKAADAAAIVHAVVSLGRGLGMKVTAEGVETADQHLFLRAAGVHFMQGYRFGRPVSASDIGDRLTTGTVAPIDAHSSLAS